jgi:hypothetical protein
MITSSTIASVLLYLAIIATSLLLREKRLYILGAILISICLLFIELPDVAEYKDHYQLIERTSFEYIFSLSNFEPGYVLVVALVSKFLPFEIFYVVVISLAIQSYLNFFKNSLSKRPYIFAVFFLSICLYFIAFSLRSTIASMFLAYSLSRLKDNRNALAAGLIVLGATFHIVIAPMIILPILNKFSAFITRRYIFVYSIAIAMSIFVSRNLSLENFIGVNEFVSLKIAAYEEANISSNSLFFGLWMIAFFSSFISFKLFNEFDRVLVIAAVITILLLHSFEFIQGRFMWLTSFLFAYIFVKGIFSRFDMGRVGRLFFVLTLPLFTFIRF